MVPIIKSSTELRKNYNKIMDICRETGQPVFLTKNGEGDAVVMDFAVYKQKERDLETVALALEAEYDRKINGAKHYLTVEEFAKSLDEAIERGVANGRKRKAV
jgi:prevent-host-death family protein